MPQVPNLIKDRGFEYRNYAKMDTPKLDFYIRERVKETDRLDRTLGNRLGELVQALLEMKSRFQNQGARNDLHELKVTGWHDYLKAIGVNPSTFRGWKQTCKSYRAFQEAADMKPPKKEKRKKRKKRDAERLANTGIDLAKETLHREPNVEKQRRLAEQIMDAVMEDDTSNLPVPAVPEKEKEVKPEPVTIKIGDEFVFSIQYKDSIMPCTFKVVRVPSKFEDHYRQTPTSPNAYVNVVLLDCRCERELRRLGVK